MDDYLKQTDFGNEAADDIDPEELVSYFVEQGMFHKFLDARKRIQIATARKGVGKSALLQWTSLKLKAQDERALVIKCRGADLVRSRFNLSSTLTTPNEYIRDWMIRLCAMVNRHLAQEMGIALTDDRITLLESAELDGFRARNLVGCLVDRFQSLWKLGKVHKLHAVDETELLKRVTDRNVWMIIDDLDATYQNTGRESLESSTFFSACRYLCQSVKGIYFRATMRTDVWAMIRRYDESLDKVEQYVKEILWYQNDFLHLLALRVKSSLERAGARLPPTPTGVSLQDAEERVLERVFDPKMPWGKTGEDAFKLVDTYKVIYTLAYERPRWAIQLCKLAQEAALNRHQQRISKEHVDEVWGEYGAKRIADLVAEHKHQCPEVEELVNAFRGCERLMTRDQLFSWINNHVSEHISARIEGEQVREPMKIARFLYRLGFIVARSDEVEEDQGDFRFEQAERAQESYEHYGFEQQPDFLSARTNDDYSVKWEIHPCYREALNIKKVNRSHRAKFERLRRR